MFSSAHHAIAAAIAAIALSAAPSTFASADASATSAYADFCVESAGMPKPLGEWDLKGNPKLAAYCKCFAVPFAARAAKATLAMTADQDKYVKEMAKKSVVDKLTAEELGFRNTCRKQLGLPLVSDAGTAGTTATGQPAPSGAKRK